MLHRKVSLLALASVVFAAAAVAADRYAFDPAHTSVAFSVRHLVINNIRGKFTDFTGTILFDEADLTKSSVTVTIKTASIDTDVDKRDDDLRSASFFDAAKHPGITFKRLFS